jgi:hypothetical protein
MSAEQLSLRLFDESPLNGDLPEQVGAYRRDRREGEHPGRVYYTDGECLLVIKGPPIGDGEWHIAEQPLDGHTVTSWRKLRNSLETKQLAVMWAILYMRGHREPEGS